jgi:hypothetical protein
MLPTWLVRRVILATLFLSFSLGTAATPAVGNQPLQVTNLVAADPGVPRPPGTPCVVPLLTKAAFTDSTPRPYTYAPPASCSGRWAKVVLEIDVSNTAFWGIDSFVDSMSKYPLRVWLGGVNLYLGLMRDSQTIGNASPPYPPVFNTVTWHAERDLTDYTALFRTATQGAAIIGTAPNIQWSNTIEGSARLLFYPASAAAMAPEVPDAVYPLGSGPAGDARAVPPLSNTGTLAKTLSLPRNIERAYLDVLARDDVIPEWFNCIPRTYTNQFPGLDSFGVNHSCYNSAFREVDISIDGQPAGLAPLYPGLSQTTAAAGQTFSPPAGVPSLNMGLQSADVMPYRVDLTPFAGILSNGVPHTVALGIAHFATVAEAPPSAVLLIYRDNTTTQVTGQITQNTLADQPSAPDVSSTLTTGGDIHTNWYTHGSLLTRLNRQFLIEGYVDTSHGRVRTQVAQNQYFSNTQYFDITNSFNPNDPMASLFLAHVIFNMVSQVAGVSRTYLGSLLVVENYQNTRYPRRAEYYVMGISADAGVPLVYPRVNESYEKSIERRVLGVSLYKADVSNQFDFDITYATSAGQFNTQSFDFSDSLGSCYHTEMYGTYTALTSSSVGQGCPNQQNHVFWFSHPDGSPDSLGWLPSL